MKLRLAMLARLQLRNKVHVSHRPNLLMERMTLVTLMPRGSQRPNTFEVHLLSLKSLLGIQMLSTVFYRQ
jgi:hypothetical protein